MNRELARVRLDNNRVYRYLRRLTRVMDDYYLDAAVGLIPGGIGDAATTLVSLAFVYVGAVVVRSPALCVALLNNTIRDLLIGLIPFYIGDVLDVLHRSNRQNLRLIDGYVDGDAEVVRQVHSRVWQGVAVIVVMLAAIVGLVWFTARVLSAIF